MSDESLAPVAGEAVAVPLPADAPAEMSVSEAARLLSQSRRKPEPAESAEPVEAATADEPELADEANADQPLADPSEVTEEPQPADEPPIERPRSWAKELDEEWASYPRAAQEKIAKREQERDAATRRSQNEAAEIRKAAEAEREAAAQERKSLAAKLPEVQRAINEFLSDKYPDIKSMDDVTRMARDAERLSSEDPFTSLQIANRLKAWEVDQRRIQLALSDAQAAQAGEARERELSLLKYRADENEKLAEFFPEVKNPDELKTLTTKAINHLKGFDLSEEQLNEYAAQGNRPFIFSAGFQRILLNSLKYEELKAAPKAVASKVLPPVQRPGTAQTRSPSAVQTIQVLQKQLSSATGDKAARIAAQLLKAQRAAASR